MAGVRRANISLSPPTLSTQAPLQRTIFLTLPMSLTHPTAFSSSSSSKFQLIINNAWTPIKSVQRTIYLFILSPPDSKLVTPLVPLSISFKSKSKDQINHKAAVNDGSIGLIQPSMFCRLSLPFFKPAPAWYGSRHYLSSTHSYLCNRHSHPQI